ncbi:MAG: aldo/keto reductase, partial [Planctomycetota bacterium]
MSAVGFGGMQFDTTRSKEENATLIEYAVDQGINYLDTAPGY